MFVELGGCWINIFNLEDFNEVQVSSLHLRWFSSHTQARSSTWVKFRMNTYLNSQDSTSNQHDAPQATANSSLAPIRFPFFYSDSK